MSKEKEYPTRGREPTIEAMEDIQDDLEEEYDDMEAELNAKADRRASKKETMPMDGRGLIVNNINRKFRQVRRQEKES